jgi:hypothetical protein
LAAATHWEGASHADEFGEVWLHENLTGQELRRYLAWKGNKAPPEVDWNNNKESRRDLPADSMRQKYCDMAAALNVIYPNCSQPLDSGNAAWFERCKRDAMPLVQAVMKIKKAGILFIKERDVWTSSDIAEMQTIQAAVSAAETKLATAQAELNEVSSAIKSSIRLLRAKEAKLNIHIVAHKQRLKYRVV